MMSTHTPIRRRPAAPVLLAAVSLAVLLTGPAACSRSGTEEDVGTSPQAAQEAAAPGSAPAKDQSTETRGTQSARDGSHALVDSAASSQTTREAAVLVSEPFTESRFKELTRDGGLVLVEISATWCPTCREQKQVLARFQQQHPEVPLTILNVDFDKQKQWVKHFKAPRQSTLALYRGGERVWFSVGEQREKAIFEALLQAAGASA